MKAAMGEVNLTVITVVAIAAIGIVVWPIIDNMISEVGETACVRHDADGNCIDEG